MQRNPAAFFLMALMFFICGALLLYRVYHTDDTLIQFNATVKDKILSTSGGAHPTYTIDFSFEETKAVYAIQLGKDQDLSVVSKVDIGKNYTFYFDPSVPVDEYGKQPGIRVIKNGAVVVYRKAYRFFMAGAVVFLVLGSLLIMVYYRRMRSLGRVRYRVVRKPLKQGP